MSLLNLFGWSKKMEEAPASACGTACGAAGKPEETPAACGTACGAADKPEETPSACGSAFRSARRGVLHRELQEHRITSVRNTVCTVETVLSTVRYRQ